MLPELSTGDEDFLRQSGEKLAGQYPGAQERINALATEGVGRVFNFRKFNKALNPTTQKHDFIGEERIGYIIPTNPENTEHIVLFNTGDILVITAGNQQHLDEYKLNLAPSEEPAVFSVYVETDLYYPDAIASFAESKYIGSVVPYKVVMRNNHPEQTEQIKTKFNQALNLARAEKHRRDNARKESLEGEDVFKQIDEFLKGNRPNSDSPPTPEEPPTG